MEINQIFFNEAINGVLCPYDPVGFNDDEDGREQKKYEKNRTKVNPEVFYFDNNKFLNSVGNLRNFCQKVYETVKVKISKRTDNERKNNQIDDHIQPKTELKQRIQQEISKRTF